jgi:hypothetical protein
MARANSNAAGIGFRVKTGRATAILLAGSPRSPQLLERRAVDLWDPRVPASRQPYHAGLELPQGEKAPIVRKACDAAHAVALRVLRQLLDDVRDRGYEPRGIGLVVTSDSDPQSLRNAHVRAHALEGQLFRDVLESAAAACGLPCLAMIEREAYDRAAPSLGLASAQLKRAVGELGAGVVKPWTAEEKTATLAAWVALARR